MKNLTKNRKNREKKINLGKCLLIKGFKYFMKLGVTSSSVYFDNCVYL